MGVCLPLVARTVADGERAKVEIAEFRRKARNDPGTQVVGAATLVDGEKCS